MIHWITIQEQEELGIDTSDPYIEEENGDWDAGGVPMGCASCGGDYPNCLDSCPLYDD